MKNRDSSYLKEYTIKQMWEAMQSNRIDFEQFRYYILKREEKAIEPYQEHIQKLDDDMGKRR